jgi:hypothetical protein
LKAPFGRTSPSGCLPRRDHLHEYRRDRLRALAQRVEVADNEVRIMGSKNDLLRTLVAASGGKSAAIGVPGFVREWRAVRDEDENYVYAIAVHGPP